MLVSLLIGPTMMPMSLLIGPTMILVSLLIGRPLAMYHDIAFVLSSEPNEQLSGTIKFYGRLGEGEIHVHGKNKSEKCATRWRTDAIMAIGVELK